MIWKRLVRFSTSVAMALWLFGFSIEVGAWRRWQQLPPPVVPVAAIIQAYLEAVVVQGVDGELYRCETDQLVDRQPSGCWQRVAEAEPSRYRRQTHNGCKMISAALLPSTAPPSNRIACVHVREWDIDVGSEFVYALDNEGHVWHWFRWTGGDSGIILTIALGGGLITFACGALVIGCRHLVRDSQLPTIKR
jgi:hypothetical protein